MKRQFLVTVELKDHAVSDDIFLNFMGLDEENIEDGLWKALRILLGVDELDDLAERDLISYSALPLDESPHAGVLISKDASTRISSDGP